MNRRITSKEAILEQAMEIAKREGPGGISIRKLAAACKISIGSVYNYYADKEQLTDEVVARFWEQILMDQEKIYRWGMGFTQFLEQYYHLLYGRLSHYDRGWLEEMYLRISNEEGQDTLTPVRLLLHQVLLEDKKVNGRIWNMELNEDTFCNYVVINLMALLRAGESNCRFLIFLLEHLLYDV